MGSKNPIAKNSLAVNEHSSQISIFSALGTYISTLKVFIHMEQAKTMKQMQMEKENYIMNAVDVTRV